MPAWSRRKSVIRARKEQPWHWLQNPGRHPKLSSAFPFRIEVFPGAWAVRHRVVELQSWDGSLNASVLPRKFAEYVRNRPDDHGPGSFPVAGSLFGWGVVRLDL